MSQEPMNERDVPEIVSVRKRADEAWANGWKDASDALHREATRIAAKHGLNIVQCPICGVYMSAKFFARVHGVQECKVSTPPTERGGNG